MFQEQSVGGSYREYIKQTWLQQISQKAKIDQVWKGKWTFRQFDNCRQLSLGKEHFRWDVKSVASRCTGLSSCWKQV